MLMEQIDTLIFDLDNTLIDRNAAMRLAMQLFLKTSGYHEPARQTALDEIMDYDNWGYTNRDEFCSWFLDKYRKVERKFTPSSILTVLQVMIAQRIKPDASIQACLQTLVRQYKLVLATNGGSKIQRIKLQQAQLESFFQPNAIFISGEMGCEKPDALFFKKIIQNLQLHPERTMVIGDSPVHDIQAAAHCGLFTCWVSHGREEAATIRPNMVIKHITEISTWSKP